jgi:hypothetical protein
MDKHIFLDDQQIDRSITIPEERWNRYISAFVDYIWSTNSYRMQFKGTAVQVIMADSKFPPTWREEIALVDMVIPADEMKLIVQSASPCASALDTGYIKRAIYKALRYDSAFKSEIINRYKAKVDADDMVVKRAIEEIKQSIRISADEALGTTPIFIQPKSFPKQLIYNVGGSELFVINDVVEFLAHGSIASYGTLSE